ncbi:MAG: hypothetical protein KAI47_20340, partial [Deltaproteobacteria bacterium]|nr:hypothetical protein [Deltaproteobacteria bacterium]
MPLPKFTKESSHSDLSRIGSGEIGEKAAGLLLLQSMAGELPSSDDARVYVPNAVVLTSEVFQNFIEHNELATTIEAAEHNKSPSFDSEILRLFLESEFPSDDAIQLRDLLTLFKSPIAVRPSSVLATRLEYPFSGVYGSKLLSNTSTDEDARVIALQQAIKAVYATVFYFNAGEYLRSIGEYHARDEKLAIIIQELAGRRFGDLYHPCVSGVARSFNYYVTGHALPEDGMADIALGLGRTILDGENVWTYCPRYPKSPPPVATIDAMLDAGQTRYWSLRIDDDSSEEDLVELAVGTADKNLLAQLVSTYDADSDRLVHGLSKRGAQLLDFSPLLQLEISSFNDVLRSALDAAANLAGHAVELEVSVTWDPHDPRSMEFALIQVNSMRINREEVSI